MSQNSNTLLLFFDQEASLTNCLRIFKKIEEGTLEQTEEKIDSLASVATHAWSEDWFNHGITESSKYLRIDYDSSTHYEFPLDVLEELFKRGLKLACLEVFYDQIGEFGQFYFMDKKNHFQKSIIP